MSKVKFMFALISLNVISNYSFAEAEGQKKIFLKCVMQNPAAVQILTIVPSTNSVYMGESTTPIKYYTSGNNLIVWRSDSYVSTSRYELDKQSGNLLAHVEVSEPTPLTRDLYLTCSRVDAVQALF